jgi:hypothetical protein
MGNKMKNIENINDQFFISFEEKASSLTQGGTGGKFMEKVGFYCWYC